MTPIEHTPGISKAIASATTYTTSGALIAGSYMDYLDAHAGAFGVLIAGATFLVNIAFNFMNRRSLLKNIREENGID